MKLFMSLVSSLKVLLTYRYLVSYL